MVLGQLRELINFNCEVLGLQQQALSTINLSFYKNCAEYQKETQTSLHRY
jgi:hypothetical protein